MEKYFSSAVCRKGYCSSFNTIYKKDASSRVFILSDGDDTERSVFFKRLVKNFKGYSLSVFNPFYDESPDGIFIKNLNTYILSDGGFNKISPAMPGEWEKYISVADDKSYPLALRREIINLKALENDYYKKASEAMRGAAKARERAHREASSFLDDEKLINFLRRFCPRILRNTEEKGGGTVRLLSSATPLGLHTHWNSIFDYYETTVEISGEHSFAGAVISGILKDYAASRKTPFIMSPSCFSEEIPQFLLFPSLGTAVIMSDASHPLPFSPTQTINSQRFLKEGADGEKIKAFSNIEKKLLDKCVLNLYEGRDCRFKYNDLVKDYSESEKARKSADTLTERLMN